MNGNADHVGSAARPMIGIIGHTGPVRLAVFDRDVTLVPQVFVERVADAGCLPILLPPLPGIERAYERLDGLLLLAGPDVDPALYSAPRHPKIGRGDARRDLAELAILTPAIKAGLPVLGVCRGLQILNTIRCGTLHQHLPEIIHHDDHSPGDGFFGSQTLRLKAGSKVAEIFGGESVTVSCHHHQAVDQLGASLVATAWAADGTIEAIELADHPFAVGVQWHAEEDENPGLFLALAEAARQYRYVSRD